MNEQLERRLAVLKAEYEAGERVAAELEAKSEKLRESMLRISGAIQVLEELLAAHVGESATRPPDSGA